MTALIHENENPSVVPDSSPTNDPQLAPQWNEHVTSLVQSFVNVHPRKIPQIHLQPDPKTVALSFWEGESGKNFSNIFGLFSRNGSDFFMKRGLELYVGMIENSNDIRDTISHFSTYLGKLWLLSTANASEEQLNVVPSADWISEQVKRGAIQQILPAIYKVLTEVENWIESHRKDTQITLENRDKIYSDLLKSATAIKELEKVLKPLEEKNALQCVVNKMKHVVKTVHDIDSYSLSKLYNETKRQIKERHEDLGKVLSEK